MTTIELQSLKQQFGFHDHFTKIFGDFAKGWGYDHKVECNDGKCLATIHLWQGKQKRVAYGLGFTPMDAIEDGLYQIAAFRPLLILVETPAAPVTEPKAEPTELCEPAQAAPESSEPATAEPVKVEALAEPTVLEVPAEPVSEIPVAQKELAEPKSLPAPTFAQAKQNLKGLTDLSRLEQAKIRIHHWFSDPKEIASLQTIIKERMDAIKETAQAT